MDPKENVKTHRMTCRVKILCAKTGLCLSPFEKPLQVAIQQSLSSLPPLFLLLVLPLMSVNHRTQIASGSFESSCRNGASIGKKLLKLHLTLLSDLQSAAKSIFLPVRLLGKQGSFPTAHFTPRTNRGGMLPLPSVFYFMRIAARLQVSPSWQALCYMGKWQLIC